MKLVALLFKTSKSVGSNFRVAWISDWWIALSITISMWEPQNICVVKGFNHFLGPSAEQLECSAATLQQWQWLTTAICCPSSRELHKHFTTCRSDIKPRGYHLQQDLLLKPAGPRSSLEPVSEPQRSFVHGDPASVRQAATAQNEEYRSGLQSEQNDWFVWGIWKAKIDIIWCAQDVTSIYQMVVHHLAVTV